MDNRGQVWICLLCNALLACVTIFVVSIFRDSKSTYFRYGPSYDLIIISVCVNTWEKWAIVLFFISISEICNVAINEIGSPILGFSVYNPDKKIITEFSKNELQFLANAMFTINGVRKIMTLVINVTQVDLAIWGMFISEFTSVFTIRFLLNRKTFISDNELTKFVEMDNEEIV